MSFPVASALAHGTRTVTEPTKRERHATTDSRNGQRRVTIEGTVGEGECRSGCQRVAPAAGGGTTGSTRPTTRWPATSTRGSASTCWTCSAAGGIAAYLQPSADLNPVTRTTTVPARPTDRLYVDSTHLATARGYLAQLADGSRARAGRETDQRPRSGRRRRLGEDRRRLPHQVDPTATPWPAAENLPRRDPPAPRTPPPAPTAPSRPAAERAPPALGRRLLRRLAQPPPRRRRAVAARRAGHVRRRPAGRADRRRGLHARRRRRRCPASPSTRWPACSASSLGFVLFLFPTLLPIDRDVVTVSASSPSWPASSRWSGGCAPATTTTTTRRRRRRLIGGHALTPAA